MRAVEDRLVGDLKLLVQPGISVISCNKQMVGFWKTSSSDLVRGITATPQGRREPPISRFQLFDFSYTPIKVHRILLIDKRLLAFWYDHSKRIWPNLEIVRQGLVFPIRNRCIMYVFYFLQLDENTKPPLEVFWQCQTLAKLVPRLGVHIVKRPE